MAQRGIFYSRIFPYSISTVLLSTCITMATINCAIRDEEVGVEYIDSVGRSAPENFAQTAERNRVIERNLPLVRALARRYAAQTDSFDDLVQAGTIGLIKAVDGFRPDRGRNLAAYAVPTIVGELRRHARQRGWAARATSDRSWAAGIPLLLPLDDTALEAPMSDLALERGEDRIFLRTCFRALTKRERRIVVLRYYRDLSEARIGAEIGLSQVQVSRVLRSSLEKMRNALEPR
jgi:RNA polymerase sigma-B factor